MILSTHLIAGAAIGAKFDNFFIAAAISLISHFILDAIPHNEYKVDTIKKGGTKKEKLIDSAKIAADLLIGFAIVIFLGIYNGNLFYLFLTAIFAALPDLFTLIKFIFRNKFADYFYKFHRNIHHPKEKTPRLILGIPIQGAIILLSIWIII